MQKNGQIAAGHSDLQKRWCLQGSPAGVQWLTQEGSQLNWIPLERQCMVSSIWRRWNQRGNALSSGYLSALTIEGKTKAGQVSNICGKAKICREWKIGMKPGESSVPVGKEKLEPVWELSSLQPLPQMLAWTQSACMPWAGMDLDSGLH